MSLDQDAETLRDAVADAYGRGTATYDIHVEVLDRILADRKFWIEKVDQLADRVRKENQKTKARITELEKELENPSFEYLHGLRERVAELEEGLWRMAEMKYFDDADASAAWYLARSLLGDAERV